MSTLAGINNFVERRFLKLGESTQNAIEYLGGFMLMTLRTFRSIFRRPLEAGSIIDQLEVIGLQSMPIVVLTAAFTGAVMSLQFAFGMSRFGAQMYTGQLVAVSLTRELGPVLTSLLVGGRIGAGIAAEIGSMAVTEQIDAIKALGADPHKKLVLPRMAATVFILPFMSVFTDVLGLFGGMVIAYTTFDIPMGYFVNSALEITTFNDFFSGVIKTVAFGFIISMVGCYQGLKTRGGTEGVGRSTTESVVIISIGILVADFFLTKLFLSL